MLMLWGLLHRAADTVLVCFSSKSPAEASQQQLELHQGDSMGFDFPMISSDYAKVSFHPDGQRLNLSVLSTSRSQHGERAGG